ncbi:MAG: MarC family protein [Candidatus Woesearchaeota archaeon]|nr:MarC family protein [Candidatus Woesearchaeota archaeon]
MVAVQFFSELLRAFLSIFIIMDPFGSVPVLLGLTKNFSHIERNHLIKQAIIIASGLLLLFLVFGRKILEFFGITIDSFKIAGGVILLIMGIETVLDLKFRNEATEGYKIAVVPLATPLITGPGVLTAAIIVVMRYGLLMGIIAAALSLLITWAIFRNAGRIFKVLGKQGNEILSKIMGLLLTAIAVEFIVQGIKAMMA